jgi:hypothetical protein
MKKITVPQKKAHKPELPARLKKELAHVPEIIKEEGVFTRVKHSVNPGDLIACMAAIKEFYDITQRKVIVAQTIDHLAAYYQGAVHPTTNEQGQNVCMNIKSWTMMKPLIESQYYIHSFERYEGQTINLDFDTIRGKTFVNLPNGMIQSWIMYAFPDLCYDLSQPWIKLDDKSPSSITKQVKGKIILNFTERYRNNMMDYFYLKNYADELIFSGTEREHFQFCNHWQLNIPYLKVNNFLELAYAIKEARFTLANQSMVWNLCEAMKTPRILEICSYAANCQPFIGKQSYGFYHQVGNEYYFRRLYNETQ